MNQLKSLWNQNKKSFLIYGGIILTTLILIIVIIIIISNLFRKYDYPKIESMMVNATKNYLKTHPEEIPKEQDEEYTIETDILVSGKYIKELSKLSKDSTCEGSVTITRNHDQLRYTPKLDCASYQTTSLYKTILNREQIATEKAGLYDLNDFYTYRGEYVSNYVSYLNYSWRILKFNEDIMYLILSDTLNSKTTYPFDDRFNEMTNSFKGKNTFANSRIELTLNDFYDNYFKEHHALLKDIDACIHPRSEKDKDKEGNIECFTTYPTPISLLSVYDYMNASLDPLCLTSISRNCANYNYLAKTTNKYWLLNGTNENSHEVYFASPNGSVNLDAASMKKDLRIIIAIPSETIYKDGIGTSSSPFVFYEY